VKSGAGWDRDWGWDMKTDTAVRCPVSLISSKAQLHSAQLHSALSTQHSALSTQLSAHCPVDSGRSDIGEKSVHDPGRRESYSISPRLIRRDRTGSTILQYLTVTSLTFDYREDRLSSSAIVAHFAPVLHGVYSEAQRVITAGNSFGSISLLRDSKSAECRVLRPLSTAYARECRYDVGALGSL
jgi:hypothetical protein